MTGILFFFQNFSYSGDGFADINFPVPTRYQLLEKFLINRVSAHMFRGVCMSWNPS